MLGKSNVSFSVNTQISRNNISFIGNRYAHWKILVQIQLNEVTSCVLNSYHLLNQTIVRPSQAYHQPSWVRIAPVYYSPKKAS